MITWLYSEGFIKTPSGHTETYPTYSCAIDFALERSKRFPSQVYFVGGQFPRNGKTVNYRTRLIYDGKIISKEKQH